MNDGWLDDWFDLLLKWMLIVLCLGTILATIFVFISMPPTELIESLWVIDIAAVGLIVPPSIYLAIKKTIEK